MATGSSRSQTALMLPVLLFLMIASVPTIEAGYPLRILGLFPHPGISHFQFFHPIMRGLAEAGHDVTVVSHFPDKSPSVRYKDLALPNVGTLHNTVDLKFFEKRPIYNHFFEFFLLNQWGTDACNHTLKSDALANVMRQKNPYDIIIVELFNSDCMLGIAHMLKAPIIGVSSCAMMPWFYDRMGAPMNPSYIPALFMGQSEEMNFGGRLGNWITFHGLNLFYKFFSVPAIDAMVQHKFGHNIPSVADIDVSMMFVNQHFSLSGAKPLPPSVIELGGIHIEKAKPLEADLQRLLDSAEHGVVVISWGSMIRATTLPPEKRDGILRALKRIKQKVIWKWENETLPNKPDNVYIHKWIPQRDLLCHPNVKVFMTHSGLMGSSEAAHCGVPVVATPMYGDQFLNAAALVQRGMAVIVPFEDISESTVHKALKKVMEKPYLDNAKMVAHSFNHRPQTALQSAIYWVEYVARTDGAPLTKTRAIYMDRINYYCLDIYFTLATILAVITFFWILLFRKCCGSSSRTLQKPEKLKKN